MGSWGAFKMPPTEPDGKSFASIVNPLLTQFDFIELFMGVSKVSLFAGTLTYSRRDSFFI